MAATAQEAFTTLYERLAPSSKDLMGGDADSKVFEAFKDLRDVVHPDRIAALEGDYVGRGLMAHGLFLGWRDHKEAGFLLEQTRHHMMDQLRSGQTPLPDVYRLAEALTQFCDAWRKVEGGGEA
ncbi:MAG: hypothetical protein GTO61_13465 [Gemmatimonadales bacterium]|nr:hypothetical protein [Gemmatimonadales bacterium]